MKLYSFFNSSASYRVRIALALEGAGLPDGGRQHSHRSAERTGLPTDEPGGTGADSGDR